MIPTLVIPRNEHLEWIATNGSVATIDGMNAKIGAIWKEYGTCYLISGGVTVSLHDIGGCRVWAYVSDADGLLAYRAVDV
jgi:hypothetical protein